MRDNDKRAKNRTEARTSTSGRRSEVHAARRGRTRNEAAAAALRAKRVCNARANASVYDKRLAAADGALRNAALIVAPCGDRTHDRTLTKRMLYQLS